MGQVRLISLYRFSAMVKTEELTKGGRPLVFAISSYDTDGKAIKTYEPVAAFPVGTNKWQPVIGEWQAPPNAAGILFWVVKWGNSVVTGNNATGNQGNGFTLQPTVLYDKNQSGAQTFNFVSGVSMGANLCAGVQC